MPRRDEKRWLNSAVLEEVRVDAVQDDEPRTQDTMIVIDRGPFTPPAAGVIGVLNLRPTHGAGRERVGQVETLGATPDEDGHERNPAGLALVGVPT